MGASWQAFYAHLCAASIIRAMPETEIPPAMRGDIYWLSYAVFLMYSTPDIIALMWEVQILRYNILLSHLLDTNIYNLLSHLLDSKSS